MPKWVPIPLPYIAERFIAVSIPSNSRFFAVSYEGVHEIELEPRLRITSDGTHPEGRGVFDGNTINYKGESLPTIGLFGGEAILEDASGNILAFRPPNLRETGNECMINVFGPDGRLLHLLPYEDSSDDWQQATSSADYRYIVISTPYEITLYRRES